MPIPTVQQQREVLEQHRRLAEETYGERWVSPLRKFGYKYARLHPDLTKLRQKFSSLRTAADWNDLLQQFYSDNRPGVQPTVDEAQSS